MLQKAGADFPRFISFSISTLLLFVSSLAMVHAETPPLVGWTWQEEFNSYLSSASHEPRAVPSALYVLTYKQPYEVGTTIYYCHLKDEATEAQSGLNDFPRATQFIRGRASVHTLRAEFSTPVADHPSDSPHEDRILPSLGEWRDDAVWECPWCAWWVPDVRGGSREQLPANQARSGGCFSILSGRRKWIHPTPLGPFIHQALTNHWLLSTVVTVKDTTLNHRAPIPWLWGVSILVYSLIHKSSYPQKQGRGESGIGK